MENPLRYSPAFCAAGGRRMKTFAQAAGLPGFQQTKTYAAHKVWKGSARAEIKTQPLTTQQRNQLYHDARRFDRQTRGHMASRYRPGKISTREGKLGISGLAVLQALLFDFHGKKTGRMDPSYESLARAANVSRATVGRALARLKAAGVLNWIPRCTTEKGPEGGFLMRQISNLYGVCPVGQWLGFRRAPDPPPPDPGSWGATPSLPSLGLEAGQSPQQRQVILEGSPPGSLAHALARATKRRQP